MLLVLPPSSEAVGESVVNEKIFKKTHFCEHFLSVWEYKSAGGCGGLLL